MIVTEIPDTHIHCEKLKARISKIECEWRQEQGGIEYYACQVCQGGEKKKFGKGKVSRFCAKKKTGPKKKEPGIRHCKECDKSGYIILKRGLCDRCYKRLRRKEKSEGKSQLPTAKGMGFLFQNP